eukprot:361415-Chlamydomonas_euryale.AAC.14
MTGKRHALARSNACASDSQPQLNTSKGSPPPTPEALPACRLRRPLPPHQQKLERECVSTRSALNTNKASRCARGGLCPQPTRHHHPSRAIRRRRSRVTTLSATSAPTPLLTKLISLHIPHVAPSPPPSTISPTSSTHMPPAHTGVGCTSMPPT